MFNKSFLQYYKLQQFILILKTNLRLTLFKFATFSYISTEKGINSEACLNKKPDNVLKRYFFFMYKINADKINFFQTRLCSLTLSFSFWNNVIKKKKKNQWGLSISLIKIYFYYFHPPSNLDYFTYQTNYIHSTYKAKKTYHFLIVYTIQTKNRKSNRFQWPEKCINVKITNYWWEKKNNYK